MSISMIDESQQASRVSATHGSSERIRTVTGSTFVPSILKGDGPIVVEFMSYGCGHCRVMEPVLQHVAEVLKASEKMYRVNVAVEHALADFYAIRGTPTLIMFLNGREVGRVDGPHPTVPSVLRAVTQPFEA
jgi:thioredoxin 1